MVQYRLKLLQVNITANWGSTGKIAEAIGDAAIANGWESFIAYGRIANNSTSSLIKIGRKINTYIHYLYDRILDMEGRGSIRPTQKLIKQIKAINPQYRHNIVNGSTEPSPIRLPQTHISMFLENEDSIYAYQTEQLLTKRTEVVINDNDLNAGNGKKSRYSKRNKRSRSKSVTIRKGDTLSEIAKRNGTTVAKLKRLNKISGSNIRAGKKIRVR
jgi:LysM repeat protein